jgi:hypothetical protein
MKSMKLCAIGAALMAASGGALAAEVYEVRPGDRVIIEGAPIPGGGIASGGVTLDDQRLASDVAFALHDSRRLNAMTATVVANRGEVSISGAADNFEQAQRAERIARSAAAGHPVVGMISTTSG